LAGDYDSVLGLGHGNGVFDSLLAVGQSHVVLSPCYTGDNRINNPLWVLGAWIIRGNNGVMAQPGRHLPHQGTLARVAVPTATKHGDQTTRGFRSHELQHLLQGVWGMRVIHKDREVLTAIDTLQASWHPLQLCDALRDRPRVDIQGNGYCYP